MEGGSSVEEGREERLPSSGEEKMRKKDVLLFGGPKEKPLMSSDLTRHQDLNLLMLFYSVV